MEYPVSKHGRHFSQGGFNVEVLSGVGPERERCEQELLGAGVPLPLPSRGAWAVLRRGSGSWFVAVRDAGGACRAGFAAEVHRSRALPGHLLLRVERFGLAGPAGEAGLAALVNLTRRDRRILRLHVEVFSRDEAARAALARTLAGHGFERSKSQRRYTETAAVNLTPDEAGVFSSLHKTARRNVKEVGKHPVTVVPITDPALARRMDDLERQSLARTGGTHRPQDWVARIELSRRCPDASRLVGLFRTDIVGPEALVAFAWGCGHGDHAHYDASGSTRDVPFRLSLGYPLVWDLIAWAKRHGATWFDLGGITRGQLGDQKDRLGGISDFKRFFSPTVVTVGEEWVLEPHWLRSRLARVVSAGAGLLARARAAWLG